MSFRSQCVIHQRSRNPHPNPFPGLPGQRLSKNWLQREKCRRGIGSEDLMDALSLTNHGEGWGVGFRAAARYANALAQKENFDPWRF